MAAARFMCLSSHDGRAGRVWAGVHGGGKGVRPDAALAVSVNEDGRAEAEVAQHQVDDVVPLRAGEHPDARRLEETEPGEVPAGPVEHGLPARGDTDEVGGGPARGEAHVGTRRQVQQVEQPAAAGERHAQDVRQRIEQRLAQVWLAGQEAADEARLLAATTVVDAHQVAG